LCFQRAATALIDAAGTLARSGAGAVQDSPMGICELLKGKREQVLKLAAKNGAHNVRVCGSMARGEAGRRAISTFCWNLRTVAACSTYRTCGRNSKRCWRASRSRRIEQVVPQPAPFHPVVPAASLTHQIPPHRPQFVPRRRQSMREPCTISRERLTTPVTP
jgi:hypothetical protein